MLLLSPATAARWGKQVRDGDPREPLPSVSRKGSGKPEPFVSFFVELIEQDPDGRGSRGSPFWQPIT